MNPDDHHDHDLPHDHRDGDGDTEHRVRLSERLALRTKEAAAALGVSERTLRQLRPELPTVQRGNVVLFPVDGVLLPISGLICQAFEPRCWNTTAR